MSNDSGNNTDQIQDKIHGVITLSALLGAITKTLLFQRLKHIKQLGLHLRDSKISHSRFEHSIGTYYLADKMMNYLELNSRIKIRPDLRECVNIAALLHDVGHGPWSHFWTQKINKTVEHEENSEICVDIILNEVKSKMSKSMQKNFTNAVEFIKSLISGKKFKNNFYADHEFLYEIVNNKHSDIDVDRWDYLWRDYHYAKHLLQEEVQGTIDLDFKDIFKRAKVSEDRKHIMYSNKVSEKIFKFFDARSKLHVHLYTAPETKLFESVLEKAIKKADELTTLPKLNGILMRDVTFKDKEILDLTDDYIFAELKEMEEAEIKDLMKLFVEPKNILKRKHVITCSKDDADFEVPIKVKNPLEKMKEFTFTFHDSVKKTFYYKIGE